MFLCRVFLFTSHSRGIIHISYGLECQCCVICLLKYLYLSNDFYFRLFSFDVRILAQISYFISVYHFCILASFGPHNSHRYIAIYSICTYLVFVFLFTSHEHPISTYAWYILECQCYVICLLQLFT